MIAKGVLAAVLLLLQAGATATEAYRFSRPIEWRGNGREELLAVPLDSRVYAATRAGFPDLRVVDRDAQEIPYLLEKAAETHIVRSRQNSGSKVLALRKKDANAIEITLRLDDDAPFADGLTVFTPLTNFEHRLQVFGSIDGQNWSPLVRDAEIYDYSRYMRISNRDVPLPANRYRQFKVLVEQAVQTHEAELLELTRKLRAGNEVARSEKIDLHRVPLNIQSIGLWHMHSETLPKSTKTFVYPIAGFKVTQDADKQTTIIDVTTSREPLTGIKLQTASRNFSREAVVQIRVRHGIESELQNIGSTTLEALHFRDIDRQHSAVTFPEQRREHYRIVIRNRDNPPLDITAVSAFGNGYELLFLPQADKTYSIRYGADKAARPDYDTAPIRELLRRGYTSVSVPLGAEIAAAAVPRAIDVAELLNSKFFLGTVVALMVAVLGWSLVRVGKRVERFPKE
ncbi:MAG: hypothetical protein ACU837_14090 [Gammaproteobacteria bacterium]